MGRGHGHGHGRRSRSRSRSRSGGGSHSRKSSAAGPRLSPCEQQEDLVQGYPGATAIVARPNSHGSHGSGSGRGSLGDEYPYEDCQRFLDYLYDATRLCGSDCTSAVANRSYVELFCGIKVLPDELEKKATDAAAADHR